MKPNRLVFLLLVGRIFSQGSVMAGTSDVSCPPAEEVLRQSLEARGGRESAERIQSFQAKGTMRFDTETVPYGAVINHEWPMEIRAMRPDKFLFSADLNVSPSASFVYLPPRYFANGCNGQTAWEALPGRRPQALEGIFQEERREQAAFFAWYAEPRNYRSITNLGESRFAGQRCYELKLVKPSGALETHYYNLTNHLLAGLVRSSVFGPSLEQYEFSDYRPYGGFLFPTRISYQAQDERDTAQLHGDEWITSIEVNGMSSVAFEPPSKPMPEPHPIVPNHPAVTDAEIKSMLRDWVDTDKVADAIVVGLLDDQGRRVISRGKVGGAQVNGDSVFDIASITKVFTRLLLLDMVQRGDMKLDDPVQKYLPASVHLPTRGGRDITLLHLATHTSGLPRDWNGGCTPEDLYRFLSRYTLPRDPGAAYEYSNLGACLLGQVIALKAGKPYEELLAERICRPLGLTHTYVDPQALACRVPPGAGRVLSSVNDLLQLASVCLGFTPSPLAPPLRHEFATHGGGNSSYLVLDPVRRRAVVNVARSENGNYFVARLDLNRLVLDQSPKPLDTVHLDRELCERYSGQYLSENYSTWMVRRDGNRLLVQKPWAPSCELFPQSPTNFLSETRGLRAEFVPERPHHASALWLRDVDSNWNFHGTKISAHPATPGLAFKIDPDAAVDYTGQYRDRDGHALIIRHQGGRFSVQTGAENSPDLSVQNLLPGSATVFFGLSGPPVLTFLQDDRGHVAGVIEHFYENHNRYVKFAAAPAGIATTGSDRFLGVWTGALLTQDQPQTPVVIKLSKRHDSYQASLDLPGNGIRDLPFQTLVFLGPSTLFLACPAGGDFGLTSSYLECHRQRAVGNLDREPELFADDLQTKDNEPRKNAFSMRQIFVLQRHETSDERQRRDIFVETNALKISQAP